MRTLGSTRGKTLASLLLRAIFVLLLVPVALPGQEEQGAEPIARQADQKKTKESPIAAPGVPRKDQPSTADADQKNQAQQTNNPIIDRVEVKVKRGLELGTNTFYLFLEGERFGTDRRKVQVTLTPSGGIIGAPKVLATLKRGTLVYILFTADENYQLGTVKVRINEQDSNAFDYQEWVAQQQKLRAEKKEKVTAAPSMQKEFIRVYRSLLDPKVVSDTFGKRIAKRFIVIQVTIANKNKDFQYLIHDISIKYPEEIPGLDPDFEMSSDELSMLRGVAERGQAMGWRNLGIRILRGIGSVAASLSGITAFHDFYSPSVAAFSGPTINALTDIFPDFTINQMNRLNDSAYIANSVIPRQQARVVAIFVPQRLFLTSQQQEMLWDEPTELWAEIDLRDPEVVVDGAFITEVEQIPALVTTAVVPENELKKLQDATPKVRGYIIGQFLTASTPSLVKEPASAGLTLESTGTPTDTRMEFELNAIHPVPPDTVLQIELKKKDSKTQTSLNLRYTAAQLVLKAPDSAIEMTPGQSDLVVSLAGENFIPGVTWKTTSRSITELQGTLSATADAAVGDRELFVSNKTGGAPSASITIRVKKP